jgi:hypothetical protein
MNSSGLADLTVFISEEIYAIAFKDEQKSTGRSC